MAEADSRRKSVFIAYVLWAIGGFGLLGLHRVYLHRFDRPILWWLSFGFCGIGAITDFFKIPEWVNDANQSLVESVAIVADNSAEKCLPPEVSCETPIDSDHAQPMTAESGDNGAFSTNYEKKYDVKRKNGTVVPIGDVDTIIKKEKMFLVRNSGYTYHTHYECYKNWSEPVLNSFEGWTLCTPEETEEAGCMRKCRFCDEQDCEEANKALNVEIVPDSRPWLVPFYSLHTGTVYSRGHIPPSILDESVCLWRTHEISVYALTTPTSIYVDYDNIRPGDEVVLDWQYSHDLHDSVYVKVNGIRAGELGGLSSVNIEEKIRELLSTNETDRWYEAVVVYKEKDFRDFKISLGIYERFSESNFKRIATTKLVNVTSRECQLNILDSMKEIGSLITLSRNSKQDGRMAFSAYSSKGKIGCISVSNASKMGLESFELLVGKLIGNGHTSRGKIYPIIEVYAKSLLNGASNT